MAEAVILIAAADEDRIRAMDHAVEEVAIQEAAIVGREKNEKRHQSLACWVALAYHSALASMS